MTGAVYESIVEESNDGIFVAQDGEIVYANDRIQELTEYSEDELVGNSKTSIVAPGDSNLVEGYHMARMEGDPAPNQYEIELETKSGERVPVELSVSRGEYKGSPAAISFCRDITAQKRRERKLQKLKREYEAVFENVQDPLFLLDVDEDGTVRFQRFNQLEEDFTGQTSEEVRGQTPVEVFGEDVGEELLANYRECIDREETIVYEEELAFGEEPRVWQTKLTPVIADGQVQKIVGSGRDITDQKAYERELERARTRLQVLFDEAPDAMIIHDADGEVLDVNSQTVDNLGYSRETLLSMNVTDFEVGLDDEEIRERWAEMDVGDTLKVEGEHEHEDGSTFPVEVWVSKIGVNGDTQYLALSRDVTDRKHRERTLRQYEQAVEASSDLIAAIDEDGRFLFANSTYQEYFGVTDIEDKDVRAVVGEENFEATIREPLEKAMNGQAVNYERTEEVPGQGERTLAVRYTPITDGDGVTGIVGTFRDITERVRSERQLEAQRDNLELLNQIVRHDIRNDLQVISTYAETLEPYVDENGAAYLSNILDASHDAAEITETARDVTEVMLQSETEPSPVGLRRVLEGEIDDIRGNYDKALVTVEGSIPGVNVLADDMLGSVFRNLLANAIQHNDKEVPEVTVTARKAGEHVAIEFADNGPGIPDDRKEKIFEEGEQGLDSGGTGLGLYLVETLVDRYGGDVYVEDNEPEGSVFVVTVPAAD